MKIIRLNIYFLFIASFLFSLVLLTSITYSATNQFGFCGGMPAGNQALSKKETNKALKILGTNDKTSIKANCMDCHAMVSLVSSMAPAQRAKWFKGIKYLREAIKEMTKE